LWSKNRSRWRDEKRFGAGTEEDVKNDEIEY
jgi:hypothetical protein